MTDTRALKAKNNESGTITQLLSAAEVTTAHLSPTPEATSGIFVMNPGTAEEESIFYSEKDDELGTVSGLIRDIENQNGGSGREAQANAPWETLQSVRYVNNLVDIVVEGYRQEINEVARVDADTFTVKTNQTTIYTKGRILRFSDGSFAVVSAASTYSAGTGLTTVDVTGAVPVGISSVEIALQPKGYTDRSASAAEINAGLIEHKWLTPKSVADSNLSGAIYGYQGALRQALVNGDPQVWQRGVSFAASGSGAVYTADKWKFYRAGLATGATVSRQTAGLNGSIYSLRVQRDSGNTGTQNITLVQIIESLDAAKYRGRKLTLSFYAKCGANYSPNSSALAVKILTGTGTDENLIGAWTGAATMIDGSAILTTSWQKFTFTTANVLADTANEIALIFENSPTGTAGANDWYEIDQAQINVGEVALPFLFRTYEEEEDYCDRYCQAYIANDAFSCIPARGNAYAANGAELTLPLRKKMRGIPTLVATASDWKVGDSLGSYDVTAMNLVAQQNGSAAVNINVAVASGLTTSRSYVLLGDGTAGRKLILENDL